MQRLNSPGSTSTPKQPPPPPIRKNQFSQPDSKTIPPVSETATLPILRSVVLKMGQVVKEDKGIALHTGVYDGRAVAVQRVSAEVWAQYQDSWTALYQCHSPFWLPVLGTCEQSGERMIVMAALPKTQWSSFLASPAADARSVRYRVVRDVAVGWYHSRLAGAALMTWQPEQLYLDSSGRVKLVPCPSSSPISEAQAVFALGRLLWQAIARSTTLVSGWQQGAGLPPTCPAAIVDLIKTATNPVESTRPPLKVFAKALDALWQHAASRSKVNEGFGRAKPVEELQAGLVDKVSSDPVITSASSPAIYEDGSLLSFTSSVERGKTTVTASVSKTLSSSDQEDHKLLSQSRTPTTTAFQPIYQDDYLLSSTSPAERDKTTVISSVSKTLSSSDQKDQKLLSQSRVSASLSTQQPKIYQDESLLSSTSPVERGKAAPTLSVSKTPAISNPKDQKLLSQSRAPITSSQPIYQDEFLLSSTPPTERVKTASLPPIASDEEEKESAPTFNLLLVDDQTVSWLSTDHPQYQAGINLCVLRDTMSALPEAKRQPPLQEGIDTLLHSPVEVLLWLSADTEDPKESLQVVAQSLWQTPEWQTFRPGDPAPKTWLPLMMDLQSTKPASSVFSSAQLVLPSQLPVWTEAAWQVLHTHYAVFWLVHGVAGLPQPSNLYVDNALHQAQGQVRLVVHSPVSYACRWIESTYFMPYDREEHLLPARYTRSHSAPGLEWEGRYPGKIGSAAQETVAPSSPVKTPSHDLSIDFSELKDSENQLGASSVGQVVRGVYRGQAVAIKYFKDILSDEDKAPLLEEAAVMAKLDSPFLIHLLGLSLEGRPPRRQPLMIMELADGDLETVLKDTSRELPWSWRFQVLRDIAVGLLFLHHHELVHRDLKSRNVLLRLGRALLCDFGFSTLKTQAKDTTRVGTTLYNAPEVLSGKAANAASDVYSFAMICWEVAAREIPYRVFKYEGDIVTTQVTAGYRESIPADCPPELAVIIQAGWSQDPAQRPSIAALAQVLEHLWQQAAATEQRRGVEDTQSTRSELKRVVSTMSSSTVYQRDDLLSATPSMSLFREMKTKTLPLVDDSPAFPLSQPSPSPHSQETKTPFHALSFATLLTQAPRPCWQDRLSPEYTVGVKLKGWMDQVVKDAYITQELSCYVVPNGQSQPGQSSDPLYPWIECELLKSPAQVLVLLGLAGAGKSTFNRFLLRTLLQNSAWQRFRPGDPLPNALLPIWIPLGSSQVKHNDLWGYLQQAGFTHAEIAVLQHDARVIFIADGYDEIPQGIKPNLFDLNFREDKNVKLIIGCRSQSLHTLSEADAFVPHTTESGLPNWTRYRSRYVAPFTKQQTEDYIDKYVVQHQNDLDRPKDWDAARYKKEFAACPEFQTLIDTPFMLWMTLSILPQLASDQTTQAKDGPEEDMKETKAQKPARTKITRADLYDRFMTIWFGRQARKAWQQRSFLQDPATVLGKTLMQALKIQASQTGSEDVQVHWLQAAYRLYCLRLAEQLTQAGKVNLSKEPDRETKEIKRSDKDTTDWLTSLLDDSPDSQHLRQGSPLRESSDHSWGFIHASLLDYFMTTAIAEGLLLKPEETSSAPFALTHAQAVILLVRAHLTHNQANFLIDRVKTSPVLQQALFALIERSKTEEEVAIASANAATLLNACRINFCGLDWQHVRLPGADLRYGLLAHSDLRGANLRGATLMRTILYQAKLEGADLRDVRWGEWPWLQLEAGVSAIAQHPTQPWLAVAQGYDIVLLHSQTGERIGKPFKGHMSNVKGVCFSPDGRLLASGSGNYRENSDNTVRLWDVDTQSALGKPLKGHTSYVNSVCFSPDGRRLVSGSNDNTVRLWDVDTQSALGEPLIGHKYGVTSVSFSWDDCHVVSGGLDATLCLWDMDTQSALGKSLKGHTGSVNSVAFSPDGRRVVSGGSDTTVRLWDVLTQDAIGKPLVGHTGGVESVCFSPDGHRVVSGSRDATLRLWDVDTQSTLGEPLTGHTGGVESVCFSPDGRRLVSGSNDNTVHLWDVETQGVLGEPLTRHTMGVRSVSFSPDGRRVASGSWDKTVRLWDVNTQSALGEPLTGHTGSVTSVAFSPDGKQIVSGSFDNTVRLWEVATQAPLGEPLTGHTDRVTSVSFSPDGKHIVSGSEDTTLRLWDVEQQVALGKPLKGHMKSVSSVCFSPDGRCVVSGSEGSSVRLWDVDIQRALGEPLAGHESGVTSVSFSPDGRYVISGSEDTILRLWNTRSAYGELFKGHTGSVNSVAFSPDGHYVISGSDDTTLRLWGIASGQCVAVVYWLQAIKTVAMIRPESSFTTLRDLDSKSSRRSVASKEEDLLAIGDTVGMISFWAVSRKDASIRFLGMPRHSAMPLWVEGATFRGCRMDHQTQRLLAQYGAKVGEVALILNQELLAEAYQLSYIIKQPWLRRHYLNRLVHCQEHPEDEEQNALQRIVKTLHDLHDNQFYKMALKRSHTRRTLRGLRDSQTQAATSSAHSSLLGKSQTTASSIPLSTVIPEEKKHVDLTVPQAGLFGLFPAAPKTSVTSPSTSKKPSSPSPRQHAQFFPPLPEQKTPVVNSVSTKNTLEHDLAKRFSETVSSASSSSSSSSSTLHSSTASSRSASTSSTTTSTTTPHK